MSSLPTREIRNAFQKALNSLIYYNLKVKNISSVRNNGMQIEVHSVNLLRIKDSQEFDNARLKLIGEQNSSYTTHRYMEFRAICSEMTLYWMTLHYYIEMTLFIVFSFNVNIRGENHLHISSKRQLY